MFTTIKIQKAKRTATAIFSVFLLFTFLFAVSPSTFSQTKKKKRPQTVTKKKPMTETFDKCLPDDITLGDVVSYNLNTKVNVTVKDELTRLKAKCTNGKLVDEKGKEIKFFRPSCWGNPPADYQEIISKEQKELEELKKKFTVIVINCNPLIP